ncbi:MAG TPA: Gfo/Idh/MocA family oxidoreductase [Phycisphaerae bacterium]|nr:Gfo/Idh/MocA family oxidoreductase [Phycisphaerae bacterium]
MSYPISRRRFLKGAAMAAGVTILSDPLSLRAYAQNRKLDVALIGVGGQGGAGHGMASGENVVAMCDADEGRMGDFAKKHSQAKTYTDWRKLYDNHKKLNLVLVATPDHTHFPAAYSAIIRGAGCYCEKPLTHSVWEARMLAEATKKHKVPTQMGNQGHAGRGIRFVVEWVNAGVIGDVTEIHTWTNRPVWPQGKLGPFKTGEAPKNLNWDAWLGVAPKRPYITKNDGGSPVHPFAWRGWFDYGCGAVGDMGCHTWDNVWWSMGADAPLSAEPIKVVELGDETFPKQMLVKWMFPAKGKKPAWTAYWYEGGLKPDVPDEMKEDPAYQKKAGDPNSVQLSGSGNLFIGTKGKIYVQGDYSDSPNLIPSARMNEFKGDEMKKIERIPDSPGHREELIKACRGEQPWDFPKSNFTYAGPMVEAMNLANVAVRVGQKVTWNPKTMKCPGCAKADAIVKREYRKGWWNI